MRPPVCFYPFFPLASEKICLGPGTLLLAEPFMQDPLFGRAVVLLCQHDDDGSFGFIINKPVESPFAEGDDHPLAGFPFYSGGPMDNHSVFFVHQLSALKEAIPLQDGFFWQGDYDELLDAIENHEVTEKNFRLILGYSGWGAGQLEEELEKGFWMVNNGPLDYILETEAAHLWKEILQRMGPYFKMVSNFPSDPTLN